MSWAEEEFREIDLGDKRRDRGAMQGDPLARPCRPLPDGGKGMARTFQTGVYSLREVADYFGVRYSTVSRTEC